MATLRQVQRPTTKQTVKATVTATAHVKISIKPSIQTKLLTELRALAELKPQLKSLKVAADKHTAKVRALRESTGYGKLEIEGFKMSDVPGTITYFDKDEFVLRGGDLALYNDCQKSKPKKAYEKITMPGEKETEY